MERTKEQQEAIIERIKLIMKEKSLNQTQFGKEIDMAQAHISSYLSGRLPLTDNFIYPIIFKFRINLLWLEFGEKTKKGDVEILGHRQYSVEWCKDNKLFFIL